MHVSCVLIWSWINDGHGQLHSASLHISCFLKRSGTNTNKVGSILTASLHISWVFKWSGTSIDNNGYFTTTLMHMSYFLKRSGTFINEHRPFQTALLHISCVLKWSGTSTDDHGPFSTSLSHISCVLKLSDWSCLFNTFLISAYQIIFLKHLPVTSTTSFHLLACTNPLDDRDARQQVKGRRQRSYFMDRKNDSRFLNQRFLMMLIFVCVDIGSRPLSQCFLMTYLSLMFIWFLSAQITLVLVLNHWLLILRVSLIFYIDRMSRHLNQRFIAEYSQVIFVWFLYAQNCPKTPH